MIELLNSYDLLISKTNNFVRTLQAYPTLLTQEENKYLHQFFDRCLFTALNQLDLIIGLKYLDVGGIADNQIETNYFARVVAHTSFEILNELNKLSGLQIRQFISTHYSEELLAEIDNCIKDLNGIRKEKLPQLKGIRNNLFGHKNKDAFSQTEAMLKISNREIYQIGNAIFKTQMRLLLAFISLMKNI